MENYILPEVPMEKFISPEREIPIMPPCDVLVAGGGPAGVMAAISAARHGAKTQLIESSGMLGGIWTNGLLPHFIENHHKGLLQELRHELLQCGAHTSEWRSEPANVADFDPEIMKVVLERMCADAGVDVQLYTHVCNAHRDANGKRLETVVTESKSGAQAWQARTFIDATGDGDLGALAGCGFDIGHPDTGQCQPMSMMALLSGYGTPDAPPFSINDWGESKDWLLEEIRRGGHDPSYSRPTMFLVHDGSIIMMANHQYGYRTPDAALITQATVEGRAEVLRIVHALRSLGGRWKNLRLEATSPHIGVRESRRIHGLYSLTKGDLMQGRQFDDGVCTVRFGFDVHALDPHSNKGIDGVDGQVKPYQIPLRSLVARNVSGLMMAGRCISGDFYAHSSYRVTGDAAAIGEAAGITAAHAASTNQHPHQVDFAEIIDKLPNQEI